MSSRPSSSRASHPRSSSPRRPGPAGGSRNGGRPPGSGGPNYALRRTIVLGVALLVLALLVWGVVAVVGMVSSTLQGSDAAATSGTTTAHSAPQSTPQSAPPAEGVPAAAGDHADSADAPQSIVLGYPVPAGGEITTDGIVDADGNVTVPACRERDLTVNADPQNVAVGAGVTIPVTLENTSQVACSVEVGEFRRTVTTGDEMVFDSGQCEAGETTTLLLAPGKQWSGSAPWDGRIYRGCTAIDTNGDGATDVADAGTYVVTIHFGATGVTHKVPVVLE